MVKKQTNEIKQAKYFLFTSLYEKKLSQLANFTKNNWLSGTLGFELRVRVWSGLTILQKFGYGFVGFHFQSSGFRVSRVPSRH